MEFRGVFTLLSVALLVYCVQRTEAFPRDSSVVRTEEVVKTDWTEEKSQTKQIGNHITGRLTTFYCIINF